jgi:Domain of unknown function (DUF222)
VAEQAGHGDGHGGAPRRDPGLPDGAACAPGRDAHLAGFAKGGEWDTCPPSAALAAVLEAASGPGWRCHGASREEMFGLLRQWQALESRAAAAKLGILRALIRDDDQPLPGGGYHGDLPAGWTRSLTHDVALALSMPAVSAERLMWLAWDLEGRLPGTGALLAAGVLTTSKAQAVDEALQQLSGEDAAAAEALILPGLPGKTYGQVVKLAVQAAVTVDPESATRRREDAERNRSRVEMFREQSGAAGLAGRELPTDQALAAHASVCARAQEYKESGAFPGGTRMDQYRAAAYLDLLNGITAGERIATGLLPGACPVDDEPATGPAGGGRDCACRECDGSCLPPDEDEDGSDPDEGAPDGSDPDGGAPRSEEPPDGPGPGPDDPDGSDPDGGAPGSEGPPDGGGSDGGTQPDGEPDPRPPAASPGLTPRLADLVLPLSTLLGLADRPGEGHGLGPLDPELCRSLAAAAAGSPDSRLCVTVTDQDGIAVGHGCARAARRRRFPGATSHGGTTQPAGPGPAHAAAALPARVNLTITADRLAELAAATGPPGRASWGFTRDTDPGPPGGYGDWTLTLPSGRSLTVELRPVPTFGCDHQYESHAYQPNATLRHLVQVRDGECTFPPCSRHARESDFEHATPYDQGGRTCACNAGARSRACHQVKQAPGWNVTQPRPGWHQWQTPSGRTYTQGPKRYPV